MLTEMKQKRATAPPIARIVIVCFRSHKVLGRCLGALASQTRTDFEVVIVNNDPDDALVDQLPLPDTRFKHLKSEDNLGFAEGSNLGAAGATTKWIVTLNPDAFPHNDWFENLMAGTERHPKAASFASTLISEKNPELWDGLGDCYSIYGVAWRGAQGQRRDSIRLEGQDKSILSPCAAAAAYRRDVFVKNHGFDPSYFCYLEDLDLGLRLMLSGHQSVLIHDAHVLHQGGHSLSDAAEGGQSEASIFYSHRNQIRLVIKCMPGWILLLSILAIVPTQIWLIFRTCRQPHSLASLRGLRAGLKACPMHLRSRKKIQTNRVISTLSFARRISWSIRAIREKRTLFHSSSDPM